MNKMNAIVVRAETPKKTRMLASKYCGNEGPELWLDPKQSKCTRLQEHGPATIIIRDVREV